MPDLTRKFQPLLWDKPWMPPAEWYEPSLERYGSRRCQGCQGIFRPDPQFSKQFWCYACRNVDANQAQKAKEVSLVRKMQTMRENRS